MCPGILASLKGKKSMGKSIQIYRIVDGKYVEGWTVPKVVGKNLSVDRSLYEK